MDPQNNQNPMVPAVDPGVQAPAVEPTMPTPPPAIPVEPVAPQTPEPTPAMPEPQAPVVPAEGTGDAGTGVPPTTPPAV